MSAENPDRPGGWWVYIVETVAGRLYTGITIDLERRFEEHRSGSGAKALRGDPPVAFRYTEPWRSRSEASRREAAIKRLSRAEKMRLIEEA